MLRLEHDGLLRYARTQLLLDDWKLHAPIPVVLFLHDERSNADEAAWSALGQQFVALLTAVSGQAETFLLVFPEGVSLGRPSSFVAPPDGLASNQLIRFDQASWNSGHRGFDGRTVLADDVGFIDALLTLLFEKWDADLAADYPLTGTPPASGLDRNRIYVVGVGNGGEMAYKLACELHLQPGGFRLKGIAVIGGTVGGRVHTFQGPTSAIVNDPAFFVPPPALLDVLIIHGALDDDVIADAIGATGVESEHWRAIIDAECGFAGLTHQPWDYDVRYSTRVWDDYLGAAAVQTLYWPEEIITRDGAPLERRLAIYRGGPFAPWSGAIGRVVDPEAGHTTFTWDVARLVWDFFGDPTSLVQ